MSIWEAEPIAGEPDRAIGGVPPCGNEGIGDASRAVASARGIEPTMEPGPWASSEDMPGGLESVLERNAMVTVVFGDGRGASQVIRIASRETSES